MREYRLEIVPIVGGWNRWRLQKVWHRRDPAYDFDYAHTEVLADFRWLWRAKRAKKHLESVAE